jgi:hypothetical protein
LKANIVTALLCACLSGSVCLAQADNQKPGPKADAPKKATIQGAAENPAEFGQLIADVKMEEGVNIFVEVLANIEAAKPKAEIKITRIAVMTAYMFKKWSSGSADLADRLAQTVAPELLPPIVAAAAVVMGNQAPIVTSAFVDRAPEAYAQQIRNAGAHPETVLPQGLLVSIGLPVPHSVPATGKEPTSLPLAPAIKPIGEVEPPTAPPEVPSPNEPDPPPPPPLPPPPPPVPPPYGGQ